MTFINYFLQNQARLFVIKKKLSTKTFESLAVNGLKKIKIKVLSKTQKRFLRLDKKNPFFFEFFLLLYDSLKFKFRIKFNINIRKNNIFCTEVDIYRKYFLLRCSTGKYNLHSTKKKLKYTSRRMINFFISLVRKTHIDILKKNQKMPYYRNAILNISAPISNRSKIFRYVLKFFKKKKFNLINLNLKKCFNGCRALKTNHKKSLSRQIFK